jgi:hypothetical protein
MLNAHIFAADFPSRLLFIQSLRNFIAAISQSYNDITLDSPQTANFRSSRGTCHWSDGNIEGRARRRRTVVREFTVVEISFENDEVGARKMEEKVRRFCMQLPEGVAGTPKRVLFVYPFSFLFVLLQ